MSHENLIKRFAQAGLVLKLSAKPLIRSAGADIVQIDIGRKINGSRRTEWFNIYPGHEDNRIEVMGTDKRIGQLVLLVQEEAREFEVELPRQYGVKTAAEAAKRAQVPVNQVRRVSGKWMITQKTSGQKRHFLCGLDERQLFIAQLTRACTTVREAHASLKTATVTLAEGNVGKAVRQGEWFFLPTTDEERARIELGLKKNLLVVERDVPIGPFLEAAGRFGKKIRQRVGNPHIATELIVLPSTPLSHGFGVRSREIFVRGKVRHVDHATVSFTQWHRVIRNNESNAGNVAGVGWVD
jgi:hypothetical protein